MSFLAKLNNSTAKIIGALLCIGVASGYFAYNALSRPKSISGEAFFTTDDGATVFGDSADKLPPFDHEGKPASRVTVYSIDNGRTKMVAYLERFTPEGKARLQQRRSDFLHGKPGPPPVPMSGDTEVKLPGASHPWVNTANGIEAAKIRGANAPGDTSTSVEILPQ